MTKPKKPTQILIRANVTQQELEMAQSIVQNDNTLGLETVADLMRVLLHREYNRRHGLPKPTYKDWAGVNRIAYHNKGK